MIRSPIFAPLTGGSPAQQLMHRARMFKKAADELVAYSNGEQFLPKYALLTHAMELALKAFAAYSVAAGKPEGGHISNHDLRGWYRRALQYGLAENPTVTKYIEALQEAHFTHYLRYPKELTAPLPDLSVIVDYTIEYLFDNFTPLINPR